MNTKINNRFPSYKKVAGELFKMPTLILLPSPPPPFNSEVDTKNDIKHTLTYNFLVMSLDVKINY